MARYDLDEEFDAYEYALEKVRMAIDDLPKGNIRDMLEDTKLELEAKLEKLQEEIDERDAEEWEGEYRNRQREYREMQGF